MQLACSCRVAQLICTVIHDLFLMCLHQFNISAVKSKINVIVNALITKLRGCPHLDSNGG